MVGLVSSFLCFTCPLAFGMSLFDFSVSNDTQSQSFSIKALTNLGYLKLNPTVLVSLKELCRMESKTGNRNSEQQQGHLRLVVPAHGNSSAAVPTPKNSGVAEPVYKTSQKYVKLLFLIAAS